MKRTTILMATVLLTCMGLHAQAQNDTGYPVEAVEWGQVSDVQRMVLEQTLADMALVPADGEARAFYVSRYEVTQRLWLAVMDADSLRWDDFVGDSVPAHALSWQDCQTFLSRLRQLTGKHFRLPTVAEWLRAARGGQDFAYAGSETLDPIGWYKDNCDFVLHRVGMKQPNAYGLYDMCGNVAEWCAPAAGAKLMPLCGGSFWSDSIQCQLANVDSLGATVQGGGLRLVLDPMQQAEAKMLVLTTTDGTRTQYALSDQPRLTMEKPYLHVDAGGSQASYALQDIVDIRYLNATAAARALATGSPQDVEGKANAIYLFRNDGGFNAFLNIDVDSIVYSRFSLDSLEYDNHVVQEVWTRDSVCRVPLAAVDSLTFHTPEPKYKEGVFHITEEHIPYIASVDDLSITYDASTPAAMLPQKGQVVVSDVYAAPFDSGFAGRVTEVRTNGGGITLLCEQIGMEDVFDKLLCVGRIVSYVPDENEPAGARRRVNEEGEISIPLGKFTLSLKNLLLLYGMATEESMDDFITKDSDMDVSISVSPFLGINYVFVFNVSGMEDRVRIVPYLQFDSEVDFNIKKTLFKKQLNDKTAFSKDFIPINTGFPGLYAKIKWGIFFDYSGSVSINGKFPCSSRLNIGFDSANEGLKKFVCNLDGSDPGEPDFSVSLKGSVSAGPALQLVVCYVTDKWGFPSVSYTAKAGPELSGSLTIHDDMFTGDEISMYEAFKDTKVTLAGKLKVEGKASALGKDYSLPSYELSPDFLKKSLYLLPTFTEPSFFSRETKPGTGGGRGWTSNSSFNETSTTMYSEVSRDLLFPFKVGMGVYDTDGNLLAENFNDDSYWLESNWLTPPPHEKHKVGIDLLTCPPNPVYKVRPILRNKILTLNQILKATPVKTVTPTNVSLSKNEANIKVGQNVMVEISGGWGKYELSTPDKSGIVSFSTLGIDQRYVMIKGEKTGTAEVIVKDPIGGTAASVRVTVTGSAGDLKLSANVLEMKTGEVKRVEIKNGNGEYSVSSNNTGVASAKTEGNNVVVEMAGLGSAIITVTDLVTGASAQITIVQPVTGTYAMKYWFDDQKELAGELDNITAVMDLDVSTLPDGLHALHIAVCEDMEFLGHYESTPMTSYFVKEGQKTKAVNRYFIDGQEVKTQSQGTGGEQTTILPMQAVDEGLHQLTTLTTLEGTSQTTVRSDYFLRVPTQSEEGVMRLQVSIDDAKPTTLQRSFEKGELEYQLDVSGMKPGLHKLNYQVTGSGMQALNTPPSTAFFLVDPKLQSYEYMLNGDAATLVTVNTPQASNPFELVTQLNLPAMPLRSKAFHFAVENGSPCVYAVNDLTVRFSDDNGSHADSTAQYVDVNVRKALTRITELEPNVPSTVVTPAANDIKWFSLEAHRGDGISLEANRSCTMQLFAPDGEEIYKASGDAVKLIGGTYGTLTGTYYVAVHDMVSDTDNDITVTWHPGASILTGEVMASLNDGAEVYQGQTVELSSATKDASIWYTTDGSEPALESESAHLYEGPIALSKDTELRAIATCKDMMVSDVRTYHINMIKSNVRWQLERNGWHWLSHNLAEPLPASTVLAFASEALTGDGSLSATSDGLAATTGFKVKASQNMTKELTQNAINPATARLELHKGWNWIGYAANRSQTLEETFGSKAMEGDIVSGQFGYSIYEDGAWKGTLKTLDTGRGYQMLSKSNRVLTVNDVPNTEAEPQKNPFSGRQGLSVNVFGYPSTMNITAQLSVDGKAVAPTDYALGAFCNDECRGVADVIDGCYFLTVYGSEGEKIELKTTEAATLKLLSVNETFTMKQEAYGTPSAPQQLNASTAAQTYKKGDANGDGEVNVTDIVEMVNDIMERTSAVFVRQAADVNDDELVNVTDIVLTTDIIMGGDNSLARRGASDLDDPTADDVLTLCTTDNHTFGLRLEGQGRYVACQFDVTLANGQQLTEVVKNNLRLGTHGVAYAMTSASTARVVVYSMSNSLFEGSDGDLLTLSVGGETGTLTVDNILFITDKFGEKHFPPLSGLTTGIVTAVNNHADSSQPVYDLQGRKWDNGQLQKGIYVAKGQKLVVR